MAKFYKVLVTGTFNAGKTTFVETLSDIDPVNTDKATTNPIEQAVKESTTIALDYGQVKINNDVTVHLFGTPGQPRFDFMYDILARGMDGFIFLVDANDPRRLDPAGQLLTLLKEMGRVPFVVAANKVDLQGLSTEALRSQLLLSTDDLVMPCVATDKDSAQTVVEQFIALAEQGVMA